MGSGVPVAVADTIKITRASNDSDPQLKDYVLVLLEIVIDNLDEPVKRIVYRADPAQARVLAAELHARADEVEAQL